MVGAKPDKKRTVAEVVAHFEHCCPARLEGVAAIKIKHHITNWPIPPHIVSFNIILPRVDWAFDDSISDLLRSARPFDIAIRLPYGLVHSLWSAVTEYTSSTIVCARM